LLGPPNSGKTTLFNWLTGFQHKTINYPGSTVFSSLGSILKKYNLPISKVIDTPGIYSLLPQSEDEQITKQTLLKHKDNSLLVLVLDVNKLEIQLPLFFQLKEMNFPVILVLSMCDLAPKNFINTDQLKKNLNVPIIPIKGLIGKGVIDLTEQIKSFKTTHVKPIQNLNNWNQNRFDHLLKKSQKIMEKSTLQPTHENLFFSNKWDRFFLHPTKGLVLFAGIMFALFSSIFWLASPFMDFVDHFFSFLIHQTQKNLSDYPQIADFISKGFLASFGVVFVFVPQIFILFVGISLLEDTGYLARAVTLMDGPFSKIGLTGRSFISFLSGYACAIPAVLTARHLNSKKERMMVYFSIPFMTCSARLPVYALLLSFLFYGQSAWKPGAILSLIYISSLLLGILAVFILNHLFKSNEKNTFLIDLPVYRRPLLKKVLQNSLQKTQHYIFKAGPAIFVVALIIWALSHFPMQPELSPAERIQQSYAGQIGQTIAPLFEAMGVDWRVGVALIAAFAARELFVSSLALIFNVVSQEENLTQSLLENMQTATHSDGSLIFTTASISALVVFFMLSLQCLSTTAIVYKESGSLKLALIQFLTLNLLAYCMAILVFQILN